MTLTLIFSIVTFVALICSNVSLPNKKAEAPEIQYTYLSKEPEINVEYEVTDNIFPLMYNRLDSIMEFSASTTGGEKEIEISAEIPGFTQKYEKKFKKWLRFLRCIIRGLF